MLEKRTFYVDNGAGWALALHRYRDAEVCDVSRRPVVLVPGYAMNSFILGYHPTGRPLAAYLAAAGFEVFCVDLRGQGKARRRGGSIDFGLVDVGLHDLSAAVEGLERYSRSTARDPDGRLRVDAIGCSLGGTYVFMQAAWNRDHRLARIVNLGGPLRWEETHPALRLAARLPVGALRLRGTRFLARALLPYAARVPGLLDVYLNPALCDLSRPQALSYTVDDPSPRVNAEIAAWVKSLDLILDGRNLSLDVAAVKLPLLTIIANADGVVPPATVRSGDRLVGTHADRRRVLVAGDEQVRMAHADLFISRDAEQSVFLPLASWLSNTSHE